MKSDVELHRVRTSETPASQEWASGGRTLIAAFIAMGTAWNFAQIMANLFLKPMQAELGWSRTELSFGPIAGLLVAFMLPFMGPVVDRFGARRVAISGLSMLASAFMILAFMPPSRTYYYSAVAYLSVAGAASNSVIFARGVAPWFKRRLGTAIGIMMTGISASAAFSVPLVSKVIESHGWRSGFLAMGGAALLIGLPITVAWFREPDQSNEAANQNAAVRNPLSVILRTRVFWQISGACGIAALPIGGFIGHLIPLLTDRGISLGIAAGFGSVFALAIGFGRLANGALMDRWHPPMVTAATLMLAALGAALIVSFIAPKVAWLIVAVSISLVGLAQGAEGDYIKFFSMRLFGLGNFARVVSIMAMIISAGMALGGLVFARVFDRFGSYLPAVIGSVVLYAVGGLIFATINMTPPLENTRKDQQKAADA
jgi:predicted MFS family arabinose efflux permease